jgi:2'-5' RNA ligase
MTNRHYPEYSLVIRPPEPIVKEAAEMKMLLKQHIGFGSANSQAHITVAGFDANPAELLYWNDKIEGFCNHALPRLDILDSFGSFKPRTFFIAPEKNSKKYLNQIIRAILMKKRGN